MKAIIDISEIAAELEAVRTAVYPHEFSGFGIVEPGEPVNGEPSFKISEWFLLDVGSTVLTTITVQDQLRLSAHPDIKFMRCWIHAHPVGSGRPGTNNWSTTDDNAISFSPMGTVPELMDWMIAIVRTPRGWVGRFDQPLQEITHHLHVRPSFYNQVAMAHDLKRRYSSAIATAEELFSGVGNRRQFGFLPTRLDEDGDQLDMFDEEEDEYWERKLEEEHRNELYNEVSGDFQPKRNTDQDYRTWWSRFIRDDDDGEDGSQD